MCSYSRQCPRLIFSELRNKSWSFQLSVIGYQYLCNQEAEHKESVLLFILLKREAFDHNFLVKTTENKYISSYSLKTSLTKSTKLASYTTGLTHLKWCNRFFGSASEKCGINNYVFLTPRRDIAVAAAGPTTFVQQYFRLCLYQSVG